MFSLSADLDPRKFKKDYGNPIDNARDFKDWIDSHELEFKYQRIVTKNHLHHYYPMEAYDLVLVLRRNYFLGWETINLIMKHLINNNKLVEVDKVRQNDERKYLLYLFPRFPHSIQVPYSVLSYEYYNELLKFKRD